MKPCDRWCPFASCSACIWSGGSLETQGNSSTKEPQNDVPTWDNGDSKTAPGGASTPLIQGPSPSDEEGLPHMVATSTTPRQTNAQNGAVR